MTYSPDTGRSALRSPSPAAVPVGEPGECMVRANGVALCTQTFGDARRPAILLIMGAAASMDWWEDGFCELLAAGRRFVVRYDHGDTGRSVSYQRGAPPYTLRDLAADAVGLLDAFSLARPSGGLFDGRCDCPAGGARSPRPVESLTLIATSPAGPGDPDLPAMPEPTQAGFAAIAEPAWSDPAVIGYLVDLARVSANRSRPFDEEAVRALARRALDRTASIASSMTNHDASSGDGRSREWLGELTAPALVVDGTDDTVLPFGHGLALAQEILGAHLLPLDQTGHELPAPSGTSSSPPSSGTPRITDDLVKTLTGAGGTAAGSRPAEAGHSRPSRRGACVRLCRGEPGLDPGRMAATGTVDGTVREIAQRSARPRSCPASPPPFC